MARFTLDGSPVICPSCGGTDFFQQDANTMVCNRDGFVMLTAGKAEVLVEQVVLLSDRD